MAQLALHTAVLHYAYNYVACLHMRTQTSIANTSQLRQLTHARQSHATSCANIVRLSIVTAVSRPTILHAAELTISRRHSVSWKHGTRMACHPAASTQFTTSTELQYPYSRTAQGANRHHLQAKCYLQTDGTTQLLYNRTDAA